MTSAPSWEKALALAALVVPGGLAILGCALVLRSLLGNSAALRRWRDARRYDRMLRRTPRARPEL